MIATLATVLLSAAAMPLGPCRTVDGDTLRCGSERVRLLGIDAPEKGRCRTGRRCAPGDPRVSEANLARATAGRLIVQRLGKDRYGRTLALVSGAYGDLSCYQLRARQAVYRPEWDNGRRLAAICRAAR